MLKHNYEIAQPWNRRGGQEARVQGSLQVGLPGTPQLKSVPSGLCALVPQDVYKAPGSETQPQVEKEYVLPDLYREKSPTGISDWSVLIQMRTSNPHSSIRPKIAVLIGQKRIALIGQRKCT